MYILIDFIVLQPTYSVSSRKQNFTLLTPYATSNSTLVSQASAPIARTSVIYIISRRYIYAIYLFFYAR